MKDSEKSIQVVVMDYRLNVGRSYSLYNMADYLTQCGYEVKCLYFRKRPFQIDAYLEQARFSSLTNEHFYQVTKDSCNSILKYLAPQSLICSQFSASELVNPESAVYVWTITPHKSLQAINYPFYLITNSRTMKNKISKSEEVVGLDIIDSKVIIPPIDYGIFRKHAKPWEARQDDLVALTRVGDKHDTKNYDLYPQFKNIKIISDESGLVFDRKMIAKALGNSKILLHLSERESAPLVTYEALNAGCYPLMYEVGAIKEQLPSKQHLLKDLDIENIQGKIEEILDKDIKWQELMEYGRQYDRQQVGLKLKTHLVESTNLPDKSEPFKEPVSVVIMVKNQYPELAPFLNEIKSQLNPSDQLLILDHGSTDGTLEFCYTYIPQFVNRCQFIQSSTDYPKDSLQILGQDLAIYPNIVEVESLERHLNLDTYRTSQLNKDIQRQKSTAIWQKVKDDPNLSVKIDKPSRSNKKKKEAKVGDFFEPEFSKPKTKKTIGVLLPSQRARYQARWKNLFDESIFNIHYTYEEDPYIKTILAECDLIWTDGNIVTDQIREFLTQTSIPLVVTIRGHFWQEDRSITDILQWISLLEASHTIVVLSNKTQRELGQEFPSLAYKIRVIHNGIPGEKEVLGSDYHYRDSLKERKLKCLTVTNFAFKEKVQALKDLIKVLESEEINFNLELSILGKHAESDQAKEIKDFTIGHSRYHFLGEVDKQELFEHYRQHDLFVYPSYQDSQPSVLLEAMACSLPVICNLNAGFSDFIKHDKTGFIVPISDFFSYMKTLYWDDELRVMMSKDAQDYVKENFSWDVIKRQYEKLFLNIFKSPLVVACCLLSRPKLGKAAIQNILSLGHDIVLVGLAPKLEDIGFHKWLKDKPEVIITEGTDTPPIAPARKKMYQLAHKLGADWIVNFDDDDIVIDKFQALNRLPKQNEGTVHGGVIALNQDEDFGLKSERAGKEIEEPRSANNFCGSYWGISRYAWEQVHKYHETPGDVFYDDWRIAYWSKKLGFQDIIERGTKVITKWSKERLNSDWLQSARFSNWDQVIEWLSTKDVKEDA